MAHPSRRKFSVESPESENTQSQLLHGCINKPCGGCTELAEAEAQVAIAQNLLETARKRQARAKTNLNLWHDRLVTRLPPEIVSRIFIILCGKEDQGYFWYTYRVLSTPLLLASVCQRWRNIALGTPQLWTDVEINIWKHSAQPEITQNLLSRSRSLPLYLSFSGEEGHEEPTPSSESMLDRLMNIIRSHSARWKYLNFFNISDFETSPLLRKLFDNLETMPISDGLELHLGDMPCPHGVFLAKPLRPGVFHSRDEAVEQNLPLQWDNLTQLDVQSWGAAVIIDIVRHAPRLTELAWEDGFPIEDQGRTFPQTPITHHCLETMTLKSSTNDDHVLRHITLPSLHHLDCTYGADDMATSDDLVLDDLLNFLERSELKPGRLQTFRLQYDIHEDHDHRYIELSSLTSLNICIVPASSTILHTYLSNLSVPSVLPHLRNLEIFANGSISPDSWALLSDLCQDRTPNKTVGFTDTVLEEDRTDLQSCADETMSSETNASTVSLPGTLERQYRRPLELLYVKSPRPPSSDSGIPTMEKHVLLRFLEVNRTGAVRLQFLNENGDDVLEAMAVAYTS